MNERGIISLTALFMMMILAIAIATVKNIAARQADIVRYYKLENELQAAAESYFNEVVANFDNNNQDLPPRYVFIKSANTQAKVTISLENIDNEKIAIMSLAELPKYHYNVYSVYRKISGYMTKVIDVESKEEKYEFTGYIY